MGAAALSHAATIIVGGVALVGAATAASQSSLAHRTSGSTEASANTSTPAKPMAAFTDLPLAFGLSVAAMALVTALMPVSSRPLTAVP